MPTISTQRSRRTAPSPKHPRTISARSTRVTVYIEQDEDGVFIGSVPSIPSCYAQGATQAEMLQNLTEVAKLCLRNDDTVQTRFVGIQNLELSHA